MDANDTAAVIVAVVSAIALAVLVWAILALARTLKALQVTIAELHEETLPVVAELQQTVRQAGAELQRVDEVLGTAENIAGTVDSASRLAYLALSNPIIKALAFGAGTSRAVRRFRRDG